MPPEGDSLWGPRRARQLVERVLADLPVRLAHSLQAGAQAQSLAHTLPSPDADLLVTAALLHDVGYAPPLQRANFHPLDGAWFLLDLGAPARLAGLVAHHSQAWLLAGTRGLLPELARLPREVGPVADSLTYADMTAGPRGGTMTLSARLADIATRHMHDAPAQRAARHVREPLLRAAVDRVLARLGEPGDPSWSASPVG